MAGNKFESTQIRAAVFVVLGALFLYYYLPYPVLLFNSFTPFKVVHSRPWKMIMDFRRSLRSDRAPVPLQEIDMKDLTKEKFIELTKNLAVPLVIRNGIRAEHLKELSDLKFWAKKYGNDSINCVDMSNDKYKECTVKEFIEYNTVKKRDVYSRTNHYILYKNPELLDMLRTPMSEWCGPEPLYEIFIGFKSGGSPLHAAFGINLFKQITGRKKWTLIPPSELPFMDMHLTDDAASLLGLKIDDVPQIVYSDAEWLKKIFRYEIVVNPGDVLLNPCMWMHIVENLPGDKTDSMIIGSPERHFGVKYGWKTSPFITTHLILKKILIKAYQKIYGVEAEKSALNFLPIVDSKTAFDFDNYIRNRAAEITGPLLN